MTKVETNPGSRQLRIGLVTPYTGENLGDAAIQEAVLRELGAHGRTVVGFSMDPGTTALKHPITFRHYCAWFGYTAPSFLGAWVSSRRWYRELAHFLEAMADARHLDTLVVSGGGQIDDYWGGWRHHPLTLAKWAIVATLTRTNLVVLSVGRGEISSRVSRWCYWLVLRVARYRSYRDAQSKSLVESQFPFTNRDTVTPDLAFSLPPSLRPRRSVNLDGRTLGVSPMALKDPRCWPDKDVDEYRRYLDTLADTIVSVIEDYSVELFPSAYQQDSPAVDDLYQAVRTRIGDTRLLSRISRRRVDSVGGLLSCLARYDVVIAARLHGVILSHWMAVPTVAIAYDKKVTAVMTALEQSDYCVDVAECTPRLLASKVGRAYDCRRDLRRAIAHHLRAFRGRLDVQYRDLRDSRLL